MVGLWLRIWLRLWVEASQGWGRELRQWVPIVCTCRQRMATSNKSLHPSTWNPCSSPLA